MSSTNDFQERGFPVYSKLLTNTSMNSVKDVKMDDRKKLDGFRLFDTAALHDTQQLESNSTFDIRKSLAWDSAFFTSPGVLEPEELIQTAGSRATGNAVNLLGNEEEVLLSSESLEPVLARKFESYSYRKSLAWDNAFYTSPGVLDPEELSIVNKGFKKSESHQLPAIKEVWRSTESKSTIDSDSYPLASLEFELFEDTRSSMKKPANLKMKRGRGLQNIHSSKKTDASSQVRLAAESGKLITTASLKQQHPSATAATKRSSLGVKNVKMGTGAGQSSTLSKKPCLRASSSIVPQWSTPSPKSSSSGSLPATETTSESPVNSRTKVDYRLDNFAANALAIRLSKTDKDELESSCQDSCDIFTPKSSVYTPSSASLDGWSSESSASSSMSQRSISRQSPFGSNTSQVSDTVRSGLENKDTSLANQRVKPSGLRVPSPKNGFFDEEVPLVRVRGSMQFRSIGPSLVSPNIGGANRYGKLKPPRNADGKRNVQKLKRVNKERTKENEEPNMHRIGENMCIGEDDSDKENTHCFRNQIESITKQVGIIDLGCDVLMELKEDKNTFSA